MSGYMGSLVKVVGVRATRETVAFDAWRFLYSTAFSRRIEWNTHGIMDCRRAQVLLSIRNASIFSCGIYPTSLARIAFNLGVQLSGVGFAHERRLLYALLVTKIAQTRGKARLGV